MFDTSIFNSRIELIFKIDLNTKKSNELYAKPKNELILLKRLMSNRHAEFERKSDDLK